MSNLLFHIGDISKLLVGDAERAEWGVGDGSYYERDTHITFRDADHFFRVMTPARIKLMEYIHAHKTIPSVRALAAGLSRDYANVHADVAALLEASLLEKRGTVLMVTWDGEDDPEAECGTPSGYSDGRITART
jgi:predicted transcriptional regulator